MADNSLLDNKRIAKNTLMLYIRMFLVMGVGLFTSRIILDALGIEDYGIYNIIGGVVVLFAFVNNAMVLSTQRYLNYELGRGDADGAARYFSAAVVIHVVLAIIVLLLAETLGLWFVRHYVNIPVGREEAALWVYHFTVLTTCVNMVRTPYNAAIIAKEHMSFYAYVSIVEVLLKLAVAYLVVAFPDRLVAYGILVWGVAVIVTVVYYAYCRHKFQICCFSLVRHKAIYYDLAGFSGWNLLGSMANVGASQGINIIVNMFFGVAVNAAMGVATQVSAALYSFVSGFQTAFNPQIIKSYAAGEKEFFTTLLLRTSRYSYYLLFAVSLPFFLCSSEILGIWLVQVPEHAAAFCRLMLLFSLIDALQGPLWVSAQATGRIQTYQVMMSVCILLNLPLCYVALWFTHIPECALVVKVLVNALTAVVRVCYLKRLYGFPLWLYVKKVVFTIILVTLFTVPLPALVAAYTEGWTKLAGVSLAALVSVALVIYGIGLDKGERQTLNNLVRNKISH